MGVRAGIGALALGLVLGCRPGAEPGPPEPGPERLTPQEDGAPSLTEIADAIDPGPRAALTVDLPPWLETGLGLGTISGDSEQLLAQAREQLDAWQARAKVGHDDATLEGLLELGRTLALAERAAGNIEEASPEALVLLERLYRIVDVPALANDRNLFSRMLQGVVEVVAREGDVSTAQAVDDLARVVLEGLQRTGDLHRRTVAALLRADPTNPAVPDALEAAATSVFEQDRELAIGMVRRSLIVRGDEAKAEHWLDLATLCHRALELRCGGGALAEAEALAEGDPSLGKRLETERSLAKAARRAVDLEDAPGLEDTLSRAEALVELQRYDEATALYEHLQRLHPDDARPVMGRARVVLVDTFDFVRAYEVIDAAAPRDHLDARWYELVIGVRATALVYHMLPQLAGRQPDEIFDALRPMLLQLDQDIAAFDALGADEGRVLRFLYDLGMEAWPKIQAEGTAPLRELTRGLLARTQALRARVPESRHAYLLMLAAAEFADDRSAALGVLDVAPPSEHADAVAVRRFQAALDLVVSWDATERVDAMLEHANAMDGAERPVAVRRLSVDARVVALRLGHAGEDLAALERRYQALREQGGGQDPVLLNNLAVVVDGQGRHDEAQALWAEALLHTEEGSRDVPRLNALASQLATGREPSARQRAELVELLEGGDAVEVRLAAHAWRVATSAGAEKKRATAALREAAKREAEDNFRPRNLPGRAGVILRGTMQVGLGYSTVEGLQIQLDTVGVPWLVVPCPVAIPDPRAR